MTLNSTDEETPALARHLRETLENARYPFAPGLDPLKSVLTTLDPPKPRPEPLPAGMGPRVGRRSGAIVSQFKS